MRLVTAHEPGSQVEVALSGRLSSLAGVAAGEGAYITNVLASREGDLKGEEGAEERVTRGGHVVALRIETINPGGIAENPKGAGYSAALWPLVQKPRVEQPETNGMGGS